MSDQELFKETTETTNSGPTPAPSSNDLFADKLSQIKNENGEPKYTDVEKALEALKHSQEFIPTLQQETKAKDDEIRQLREELERRESVESAIEKLTKKQQPSADDDPQKSSGIDAKAIEDLISQKLSSVKEQEQAEKNLSAVQTTLLEKFGSRDDALSAIAKVAKEMDTTPSKLEELAKVNPKMVLAAFGSASAPEKSSSTTSSHTPPRTPGDDNKPPEFDRSVMQGLTTREQIEAFKKVSAYTNKRLGIET